MFLTYQNNAMSILDENYHFTNAVLVVRVAIRLCDLGHVKTMMGGGSISPARYRSNDSIIRLKEE
jgi:hypothetical protein